ncbi:hypothetical protein EHF33_12300 [Deinococcus psychrotolerans]|uniref:Uncharacterized protein n=1 Tax=Deinococcus psychrotolerans TaxID=2489213 RepID=A0A3G8YEW8_9DEIO|nr:hypothetical protein [Deinococcus psychrotolerans]AZI43430.1 hypothetical protein EHF33_12300 [Deinococcus psychrotolerans]
MDDALKNLIYCLMAQPEPVSGDDSDLTLVEIEAVEPDSIALRQPLKTGAEHRAVLGQLLQLGMQGAVATQHAWKGGELYRMVVSPEMQKALNEGAVELVKSGKGLSGNIVNKQTREMAGRARFKPADAAKLANVATIAWQAAAMITAQHYLDEIDGKLEKITGQLSNIADFLEDKERAQLLSALQALKRGRQLLSAGHLQEHDLRVIEEDARQAFQIGEAQIEHRLLTIERMLQQAPAWDQAAQAKTLEQFGQQTQVLALALNTLAQAFAVGTAAGWSEGLANGYRSSAERTMERIQNSLSQIQALPLSPPAKLEVDRQRPVPWLLRGPQQVISGVGYQVETRFKQQRDRRQSLNEQALKQHVHPSLEQINELGEVLSHASRVALPDTATPLVLLARLDEQGQVVEVFSDVLAAAD